MIQYHAEKGQIITNELTQFTELIRKILFEGNQKYGHTFDELYASFREEGIGYTIAEKAVRFTRKKDMNDVIKIATYCYLIWRWHATHPTPGEVRNPQAVPIQRSHAPGSGQGDGT